MNGITSAFHVRYSHVTMKNRIHHVGLHDTGEHADYFSASKSEIYFKDFKTSRTFLFLHFTFRIIMCVEYGKYVMSYFASSSSKPV